MSETGLTVVVNLTKKDLIQTAKFLIYKTRSGRQRILINFLCNLVFVIVLNVVLWIMLGSIPLQIAVSIALVELLVLHGLMHLWIWYRLRRLTPEKQKGVLGRHTVEINSEGLRESTDVNESFQRWSAIDNITESNDAIHFQFNKLLVLTVPKRFFATTQDVEQFYSFAYQHWRAAVNGL